ncbi:hypothetical protein C2R22_24185 (plasmid) [Salinigranum rubrum]|uniref:Aconitase/3-isopropylmalate dehydratase large subunit alpha/beta/alpha domain-containing protein n=1 Tax=Salinigranum rubrum TaxID=755307 RepID=A0A2I8VRU8_9EURY|nr:hypothetical protein C2R22_24185 [Salinigranum rubrum]
MIVMATSRDIYAHAERAGLVRVFTEARAIVTNSTCGTCDDRSMGALAAGEVCLATQNRNYKGRMGSYDAEVYLSSPETAAASAIIGHITDPWEVGV